MKFTKYFFLLLIFTAACASNQEKNVKSKPNQNIQQVSESKEKEKESTPPDGTEEMVAYLSNMAKNADPLLNYHLNTKRAKFFESMLNQETNPQKKFTASCKIVMEYMNAGDIDYALQILNHIKQSYKIPDEVSNQTVLYYELLALAYLRLGEQENCIKHHGPDNCIIPLKKSGIHKDKRGSAQAIKWYTKMLEFNPKDDKSKWLLNLAYITIGEYPKKVPKKHLIKGLKIDNSKTKFNDIAGDLGLAVNGLSGGLCVEDFNKDGYLDIVASSYGYDDQIRYFEFENGKYSDKSKAANLTGLTGGLNMLHADFDNDGYEDILVLRGGWLQKGGMQPNSLLKNMGNGRFEDVTKKAGLFSLFPSQTAAFSDVDLDGDLDLFIGNESNKGANNLSQLYINNGNGTFKEEAKKRGVVLNAFVKGCTFADFNGDGWPDLFISVLAGANKLYINESGRFIEKRNSDLKDPKYSFPCWSWDVNNDGLEDLLVNSYDVQYERTIPQEFYRYKTKKAFASDKPALYINKGNFKFENASKKYGLEIPFFAMGSNFGDYNNDGFLDFYIGSGSPDFSSVIPNYFLENINGNRFVDKTLETGTGHIQKGHAVAFADFDQDGDQDIYCVLGGAYEGDKYANVLFDNPSTKNKFLKVKLIGINSNKSAIGAKVQLIYFDKNNKEKSIFRTVGTGGSFGSSPLSLHFGLNNAKMLKEIIVTWVNKKQSKQSFKNIKNKFNKYLEITEGVKMYKELPYKKLKFKKGQHQHHHKH